MELTNRDYEQALSAWEGGACNGLALINALHRVSEKVRANTNSTDEFNRHPIIRLYLSQLSSLAGIGIGEEAGAVEEVKTLLNK